MLCGFCAVTSGASKPQSTVPTVNDILARYVTALGGRAAISKISSRVSKGTFEIVGVEAQGTAESYAKAPNKYLSIITLPGYGEIRRCFRRSDRLARDPETGLAALVGQDLSSTRRSSDIYQAIELSELPANVAQGPARCGWLARVCY